MCLKIQELGQTAGVSLWFRLPRYTKGHLWLSCFLSRRHIQAHADAARSEHCPAAGWGHALRGLHPICGREDGADCHQLRRLGLKVFSFQVRQHPTLRGFVGLVVWRVARLVFEVGSDFFSVKQASLRFLVREGEGKAEVGACKAHRLLSGCQRVLNARRLRTRLQLISPKWPLPAQGKTRLY